MKRLGWCLLVAATLCGTGPARAFAHPAPFSFVDVRLGAGTLDVTVVAHVWDVAYEFDIDDPALVLDPDILRPRGARLGELIGERLRLTVDGRRLALDGWSMPEILRERQSVRLQAQLPLDEGVGAVTVSAELFPYDPNHQTFLNVYEDAELTTQAILGGGGTEYEYFLGTRQGVWAVLQKFVPSGVHHILIGPDHLLFLIGLLLLGGSVRQLLLVVTAFTVAHSITLSLAVLNVVTPPSRLVEPIIALSIVYVGLDNLLARGGRDMRGLDRAGVRTDSRFRIRERAARDGTAERSPRVVAVLVQLRRGARTARCRPGRRGPPFADSGLQRGGRSENRRRGLDRGDRGRARSGSWNGCFCREAWHE